MYAIILQIICVISISVYAGIIFFKTGKKT